MLLLAVLCVSYKHMGSDMLCYTFSGCIANLLRKDGSIRILDFCMP